MIKVSVDGSTVELERKMWEQFHDTGFWRNWCGSALEWWAATMVW
uniref:Uncharacterized protein n=1 Tax=Chenopodium quinoa TaxID=63459 RepID=A0A803LXK1_CHEQI